MTTRQELVQRADELLAAAFAGALETLGNPEAPPTAKASATGSALRLYEMLRPDGELDKEPGEMTVTELQRSIAKLTAELKSTTSEGDDGIFG